MKTLYEIQHEYLIQQCSDLKSRVDLNEMINNELLKAKSFIDSMSSVIQCIAEIAGVEEGDVAGLIKWAESKSEARENKESRCRETEDMFLTLTETEKKSKILDSNPIKRG